MRVKGEMVAGFQVNEVSANCLDDEVPTCKNNYTECH